MREIAQIVANMPLTEQGKARLKRSGIKVDDKNPTAMMAMIYGQMNSAINGNYKSAEFIQNLLDKNVSDESNTASFIEALNSKAEDILVDADDSVEE